MTSAPLAGRYAGSVDRLGGGMRVLFARVGAMCLVELQKLRRDRTELVTRAIQPALWLLAFGETFSRIRAIPTGGVRYLDFLAPGILAQVLLVVPALGFLIVLLAIGWFIYLLWTTYSSPTKQGFHDKFVNSMVVKATRVAG